MCVTVVHMTCFICQKKTAKHHNKKMEQELREAFSLVDRNGDGKLTKLELEKTLEALGCLSASQIQQEVQKACNAKGECEFASFLALMTRLLKDEAQPEDLQEAFRVFDKNNNGHVSADELKKILSNGNDKLTKEDIEEILKDAGIDNEGDIDYEAFVKKISSKK